MPRQRKDEPEHPEQATRIKTAMAWNNLDSAKALHEKLPQKLEWGLRTTNKIVQGDRRLKAIERPELAAALDVDEVYLRDGGPEPFTGLASPRAAQPGTRHTLSPAERLAEQARAEAQAGPHEQSSKHVRGGGQS